NYETLRSYTDAVGHYQRLFEITPEVVAYDLHPDYLSSRYALELTGVELVGVQHHHAHIASCLADNCQDGPVIGVAFDGTGYGTDATLWGGEILLADLAGFERVGHLAPVRLPGGVAAIRQPWRMAASYLHSVYGNAMPELPVLARHRDRWQQVVALVRTGVAAPVTTSAGRLFDAVASILDVRDEVNYEGQAAIELEARVDLGATGSYQVQVPATDPLVIRGAELIRAVVEDVASGTSLGVVAARFHRGFADAVSVAVEHLRERSGIATVALSGGVFQNLVLTEYLVGRLRAQGLRVLTHHRVPPNDAGISLGQAVIAAAARR
ncbi:MAG: Kae1-like domain-containing protein, partial [Mycobacteriales bacterium]